MNYLWIFLGGGLGSIARFAGSNLIARLFGTAFPWGTLTANILGSFVIGFFAALTGPEGRWPVSLTARQFVMIGVCGGYTTFSSFSLETHAFLRAGDLFKAGANAGLSFAMCMVAVWLGYLLATHFVRKAA